MNDYQKILLSIGFIILSNVLGHFFPPSSIFLTPIVVGISTFLLATSCFNLALRILLIILALITNDILIKIFAGGIHDSQGAGWINLFFIIGIAISTILTIGILLTTQKGKISQIIMTPLLIPLTLSIYLSYFSFLGLSYAENSNLSEEVSMKKGMFISKLDFSDNTISFNNDTIEIINGWSEKQKFINHKGLIKKFETETDVNYTVRLNGNKNPNDMEIYYQVNSRDINGSTLLDSVITFQAPRTDTSLVLTFFAISGSISKASIIKEIKINSQ